MPTTVSEARERETRGKYSVHQTLRRNHGLQVSLPSYQCCGSPRAVGKEKNSHAVSKDRAGPASALGDGEGRMWSLFPQTSSGNLNNSLYLPPAAPGIQLLEPRDRRTTLSRGSREPRGSATPPSPARCSPQHPEARRRARSEESGHREGGWVRGDCPRLGSRGPAGGARALPPAPPRVPCGAGPCPRPRAPGSSPLGCPRRRPRRPALPRVRSSGTFSSPLSFRPARNRHIAPIRIRSQASGGSPGSGQRPGSFPPPMTKGRQVPGVAVARRRGVRAAADLPRIRRFFSERPRPTAAILTGFSHNTGNLAQSRENPFPSPRAAPAPRGGWRLAAGGAGLARGAEGVRCQVGILMESAERALARPPVPEAEGAATRSALREHVRQEGGISHEGNPIDASLQRGGCFPSSRRGNRSQNRHEVGGGLHAPGWPPAETILHDCFQVLR